MRLFLALAVTIIIVSHYSPVVSKNEPENTKQIFRHSGVSERNDSSKALSATPDDDAGRYTVPFFPVAKNIAPGSSETEFFGDPVLQDSDYASSTDTSDAPTLSYHFGGIHYVEDVNPPAPTAAAGWNHVVETVNHSIAVYGKKGEQIDIKRIYRIWQDFGGPCASAMNGEPVTLYDQLADRWVITQRAAPNFPKGAFYQCFAVSKTSDPTGGYHRYQFKMSDSLMNRNGKLALWRNGYYMAFNQFSGNTFHSSAAVAFERHRMLRGEQARFVKFNVANKRNLLPLDLDGRILSPPQKHYFVNLENHRLRFWTFRVNWKTLSYSNFFSSAVIEVAPFSSSFQCGASGIECIPQRSTPIKLNAVAGRLMFRAAYRNFQTHDAVVLNHTVNVGNNHAGIRWYEVRNISTDPFLYQQGTYSPDEKHRWMGSIATDRSGNILLGYSVSSDQMYPSIRFVSRRAGDPPGRMTSGEQIIVSGTGSLENPLWGDYSSTNIDRTDGCTFWHTNQFVKKTGSKWYTYMGSIRYPSCRSGDNTSPTVQIAQPANGQEVSGMITIAANAADNLAIAKVNFYADDRLLGSDHIPPYHVRLDTSRLTNGAHRIYARAFDMYNNAGRSPDVSIQSLNCSREAVLTRNPAFEAGAKHWLRNPLNVINNQNAIYKPRRGRWKTTLNGLGKNNLSKIVQTVTVPSDVCSAMLIFWLQVQTDEPATGARDILRVQILSDTGKFLGNLGEYSNMHRSNGYQRKIFDLTQFRGRRIRLRFLGRENESRKTAFLIDDVYFRASTR